MPMICPALGGRSRTIGSVATASLSAPDLGRPPLGQNPLYPSTSCEAADRKVREAAQQFLRDPGNLLEALIRRRAVFTKRGITTLLRRHGFDQVELDQLIQAALTLYPPLS
jgi:hypothetical protein